MVVVVESRCELFSDEFTFGLFFKTRIHIIPGLCSGLDADYGGYFFVEQLHVSQ